MLGSSLFAAAGLFVAGAWASSAASCLTQSAADRVAGNFASLISDYSNASANAYLCSNYHDYSDSVIELINSGCPNSVDTLGTAVFASRTAFEVGQGSQDDIPFTQLNVWYNCDTVTLRWKTSTPGTVTPEQQVTGIIVLETVYAGASAAEPFLIETVYSEFNSGAWLVDLGVFVPTGCPATSNTTTTSSSASATASATGSAKFRRTLGGFPVRVAA